MYRIGIDLGGTNIAVGVVDDGHAIVSRVSVPTMASRPAAEGVRDMGGAVEQVLARAGASVADCRSMGVGSPGTCNSADGVVERAYNLGWDHVPVCRMLEQRFGIPCRLSNDANCAALAEQVAGAAVGHDNVVLVTLGTGVGGVMARTLPRDLYERTQLRHANSLLNMGILVSPLLAPLIGGLLDTMWNWRACYLFLLVLCAGVTFSMARWMPETRPVDAPRTRLLTSYKTLFGNSGFNCYLLMLIGGLAGIAAFEACSGVLMGAVLGLSSMTVSILFILPIPAAFFGAWFAGRPNKRFSTLMWQSVICCLLAGLLMWIPDWFGVMNVWTLLVPAALFFFGAGMLFPLATSGAMEPFPFLAGTAGALVGGLQNIGSGVLASLSAMLPQTGQGSLGLLMTLMGLLIVLCWLPLATRMSHQGQPV